MMIQEGPVSVCRQFAVGKVCPSKISESFIWVFLGAGEEGEVLMWYGFLGGGRCVSFVDTRNDKD